MPINIDEIIERAFEHAFAKAQPFLRESAVHQALRQRSTQVLRSDLISENIRAKALSATQPSPRLLKVTPSCVAAIVLAFSAARRGDFALARLAAPKAPRELVLVEAIPRSAGGKPLRRLLPLS